MTIKPVRPDLQNMKARFLRGEYVFTSTAKVKWMFVMLEKANDLIEPDATFLDDWQGDADEWLGEYRGESDD